MEDKLKDFIRQSRPEFDRETPGSGVFEGALSGMLSRRAAARKRRMVMAAAACLTILVVAGMSFFWSGAGTANPEGGLARTDANKHRLELPKPKATPTLPIRDPGETVLEDETHQTGDQHRDGAQSVNRKSKKSERTFVRVDTDSETTRQPELSAAELQSGERAISGEVTGSLTESQEPTVSGNVEPTTPAIADASATGRNNASETIQQEVAFEESATQQASQEEDPIQETLNVSDKVVEEAGDESATEGNAARMVPEDLTAESPESKTEREGEHPAFSLARNVLRKVGKTLGEFRENALEKVEESDSGENSLAAQFSSGLIDLYKSYRSRRSED